MAERIGLQAVLEVNQFQKGLGVYLKGIGQMDKATGNFAATAGQQFVGLGRDVIKFGAIAAGAGAAGIGAVAVAAAGAAAAGLSLNNAMEQASGRIQAFTKDGAKTAEILEMIRVRAAKTPFLFQEMAQAAANLLPAAKASGKSLEELISLAEILAASNPAEGLEGAAFSLKEALSGDFVSIVERFNLPRKFINDLKKEGVPELEIVSRALKEMGLDADLVANLAETASGRWSTFSDTLQGFAAIVTKPVFTTWSKGLGSVNLWLSKNEPALTAMAQILSNQVAGALATVHRWGVLVTELGGGAGLTIFTDLFGTQGIGLWVQVQNLVSNVTTTFGEWGTTLSSLLPSFSELSIGIIPTLTAGLTFLNEHFEEFKGALLGIGAVLGGAVFAALAAGILSLLTPMTLIIGAAALLGAAWAGNWGGIQEKTFAVWAVVQPILQQVYDWLAVNIPIAIQVTTDFWNNTLYPALIVVGNWITTSLIPTLTNIYDWLYTNIPAAVQFLSNAWTNTLLPAITTVSDYLSTNVLPLFQAFNDFTGAVFNKTIQAAAGLWQNVLWPALQKVWSIISESLQPIFESLGKMIEERVSPILNNLGGDVLPTLAEGLETVTGWIKEATGFFKGLTDAVNNFTLPPVLTPGSPTPFELALLGIANAADLAGISMGNLNNLSMPGMFDKLFDINRGITDFNLLVRKAKDGITSWGKANFIGSEKSANAIRFFTDQFKSNFSAIMGAQNPMQAWMDIINTRNWRKIQLSGGDAREMGQMFFNNFFKEAGKAASQLQDMIISGSQTALQMATTLNQFGSQQAEYLKTQVENLQDFIASGETSLDFNGNIINAVEAQELLNQKLQEQKDIQDDILKIKEQESKLQFLQSQLDLIKMIKDAGLNVKTVLGDISLGLDASIPDMLAATNNVIQAIINQVDQDLGSIMTIGGAIGGAIVNGVTDTLQIASDSKVMARLGQYTMSGFINGMKSQAPNLFGGAVSQSLVAGLPSVQGNTVTNNTYYDFNMNVNTGASAQGVIAQYGVMRGLLGS